MDMIIISGISSGAGAGAPGAYVARYICIWLIRTAIGLYYAPGPGPGLWLSHRIKPGLICDPGIWDPKIMIHITPEIFKKISD